MKKIRLYLLQVMLNLQCKECPVTVQMSRFLLLRIGGIVHFVLVHLLLLGVDLTPLGRLVREEDLTGVSPWGTGIHNSCIYISYYSISIALS